MKTFGIFMIISLLTNPFVAVLVLILMYLFIDRSFIGILPDFTVALRRKQRLRRLRQETDVNQYNANAQMELGELYIEQGDYPKAIEQLEKALVKMEDSPLVHFYLGAAKLRLGNQDGLAEVAKAIQINPKTAQGRPYLYLLQYGNSGQGQTEEELQEHILHYGSVDTFFEAGKYYKQQGNKDAASKFFQEVLDIYRISASGMKRKLRRRMLYIKFLGSVN